MILQTAFRIVLILVFTSAGLRGEALRIATYNIENYTSADRMAEGVYRKDYPKPEADKDALRAVIRQMNADVLALQEVGGEPYLRELQRDLKKEGADYPHTAILSAEDKSRMIAVMARKPIVGVGLHDDLSFKYFDGTAKVRRGLLEMRFQAEGGEFTLFVVHLKSRFTERPDDPGAAQLRAGEAVAIRDRILRQFPDPAASRFLIVGDFNDGRTARPVRAMLERGKTRISEWLPATDERGHVWTHFYRRDDSYSRVDHMLISPGLRASVRDGRGWIHDSPEVAKASDHRPVLISLEWAD